MIGAASPDTRQEKTWWLPQAEAKETRDPLSKLFSLGKVGQKEPFKVMQI